MFDHFQQISLNGVYDQLYSVENSGRPVDIDDKSMGSSCLYECMDMCWFSFTKYKNVFPLFIFINITRPPVVNDLHHGKPM